MGFAEVLAETPQKLEHAAMLVAHAWQDAYGKGNEVAGAVRDEIVSREIAAFLIDKPPVTKTLIGNSQAGTIAYIGLSNDILHRIAFTLNCCHREEMVLDELYPLLADIAGRGARRSPPTASTGPSGRTRGASTCSAPSTRIPGRSGVRRGKDPTSSASTCA